MSYEPFARVTVSRAELPSARSSVVVSTPGPRMPRAWVMVPLFSATNVTWPGLNVVRLREILYSTSTAVTVTACGLAVVVGAGVVVLAWVGLAVVTTGLGLGFVATGVRLGVAEGVVLLVLVAVGLTDMDIDIVVVGATVLAGSDVAVVVNPGGLGSLVTAGWVGRSAAAVAAPATAEAVGWLAADVAGLVAGAAVLL